MLKNKQINKNVPNLYKVSCHLLLQLYYCTAFTIFPTATNLKRHKDYIIIVFQPHY